MKKALCLLLTLCVVTALFGCRKLIPDPSGEATEPTVQTQTTTESIPITSVSLPHITETVKAHDGTAIFHYVHPDLTLALPEAEIANKITLDHLRRLDAHQESKSAIAQSAEASYLPGQAFTPYLFSIHYNPMRVDPNVLSFSGVIVSYRGGGHADQHCFGMNYDLKTGETLTLGSILKHIDAKKALEDLVIKELAAVSDTSRLYEGYDDLVRQRFMQDESYDENWYFSDKGLCFFFSPYEIAPYTSGIIVAEIPYASLNGLIADEYHPEQRTTATGTLHQQPLQNADLSKFTQISELVLEKESDKALYFTDTVVHDVRIFQTNAVTGYRSAIFAAYALTASDALMIEAPADTRNSLTISYVTGDKTVDISH